VADSITTCPKRKEGKEEGWAGVDTGGDMRFSGVAVSFMALAVACSGGKEQVVEDALAPDGDTTGEDGTIGDVAGFDTDTEGQDAVGEDGEPTEDAVVVRACDSDSQCNDGNPCTTDKCEPAFGCVNVPKDCSDGTMCTNDSCRPQDGQCLHEPISCADLNACTTESCDPKSGCVSAPLSCDDGDECTSDGCSPATGCVFKPLSCDDGDPCTDDKCHAGGGCESTPSKDPNCCVADFQCDDSLPCTQDDCVANSCAFTPIPGLVCCSADVDCEDDNDCTLNLCLEGLCQVLPGGDGCCETATDCDDSDGCTTDTCENWFCMHAGMEGCCHEDAECGDGEICTDDVCSLTGADFGFCENKPVQGCCHGSAVECDDGNVCTLDDCPGIGEVCTHDWAPGCCLDASVCDDQDLCTQDSCVANKCSHLDICCYSDDECDDDDDECTIDKCVESFCKYEPTGTPGCCVVPLFKDWFSKNLGWDYGTNWERAAAKASAGQAYAGPDPAEDHTGSADNFVAGVVVGGNAPTDIVHDFYWLTSPAVNTTGFGDSKVVLSFWRWLNSDYEPFMTNAIEVFNGAAWVSIWQTAGSPGINDTSWQYQEFDVTPHANPLFRVRFGYKINDLGVYQVASWNLDDVNIHFTFSSGGLCCMYDTDCQTSDKPGALCSGGVCD